MTFLKGDDKTSFISGISEIFSMIAEIITFPLTAASYIKIQLETVLASLDNLQIITVIQPFAANIKYVTGDFIYTSSLMLINISITIAMIKALYTLIKLILDSDLIKLPTKFWNPFN